MRILVAAKRLAADRTSEGICSSKYVGALAAAGHDVHCLTGEALSDAQLAWHAINAPVTMLGTSSPRGATSYATWTSRLSAAGAVGHYSARKLNGLSARATGYALTTWAEVARWREAIRSAAARVRPDVVVVRGAGREFEPQMAMLGWRLRQPWIAHYHDPYPGSLYPAPYRLVVPLQSARQENVHRNIVAAADALTFPSRRLLEWVLRDELSSARGKAFVVPHIAGGLRIDGERGVSAVLPGTHFNLVHAGTLLRERDPAALLEGVLRFTRGDTRRQQQLRLLFVGRVDPAHTQSGQWRALTDQGLLHCVNERVSYGTAMTASAAATCLIVLEAGEESPFFPAKLADCIAAAKPILAISPAASVTADLLGREYPLRVPPGDSAAVAAALERLWSAWSTGDLASLAPPASAVQALTPGSAASASTVAFDHVLKSHRGRAA